MTDYAAVLTARHPGTEWSISDNDYSTLDWAGPGAKPTKKSLDDAWPDVEQELVIASIQQARQRRYQAETDPMFFRVQRGEDGITLDDWKAAVDQIRADLPYPA